MLGKNGNVHKRSPSLSKQPDQDKTVLFFREPEKRVCDKKPSGSISPPAGGPAAAAAAPPASAASIRSACLPYAPAFSVLLQCLKMVHRNVEIMQHSEAAYIFYVGQEGFTVEKLIITGALDTFVDVN